MPETKQAQLQMLYTDLDKVPAPESPEGYELRCYRDGDKPAQVELMRSAGFETWGDEQFQWLLCSALPDGIFFAVEHSSGKLAATCSATHKPSSEHPFGGELGWVATAPEHQGHGLGRLVCEAVTARFIRGGYKRIYLKTDDFRLPAIKLYLKMGWNPFLFQHGMEERWKEVCAKIGIDLAATKPVRI